MTKQELKQLLAIARPAIIAVCGRSKDFKVSAYNIMNNNCLWVEIEVFYYGDLETFKLRLENGKVTYLKNISS